MHSIAASHPCDAGGLFHRQGRAADASIGVVRALNRHVERVFNPDRKDTQQVSQFERKASKA
jgi:hypothetical protein